MPRRFLLALLLSVVACWAHASGPVVGTPAPAALGMARDGDPVDLQQFRGKIVVVTFWASWCTYCLKELPVLDALQQQAGELLQVVAVNVKDSPQDYRAMMRQMKGYRLLQSRDVNGRIADSYGVTGYPSLWIIDREGKVAARHVGYAEDSLQAIVAEINAVLRAGGTVPVNPG